MGTVYSSYNDGQIIKKDEAVLEKEKEFAKHLISHYKDMQLAFKTLFGNGQRYDLPGVSPEEYDRMIEELGEDVKKHDMSKFSPQEFDAYRIVEYPTDEEKKLMEKDPNYYNAVMTNYENARQHHYDNNDHHARHWYKDNKPGDIPMKAILYMICDWSAEYYAEKHTFDCTEWYIHDADKEKSELNEATRKMVETVLFIIFGKPIE